MYIVEHNLYRRTGVAVRARITAWLAEYTYPVTEQQMNKLLDSVDEALFELKTIENHIPFPEPKPIIKYIESPRLTGLAKFCRLCGIENGNC